MVEHSLIMLVTDMPDGNEESIQPICDMKRSFLTVVADELLL